MEALKLKNEIEEAEPLVRVLTELVLPSLMKEDPISFYELVMKCRDRNHKIFSKIQEKKLQELKLLQPDGIVHGSIANIVINAVEGNGLKMKLVSPLHKNG